MRWPKAPAARRRIWCPAEQPLRQCTTCNHATSLNFPAIPLRAHTMACFVLAYQPGWRYEESAAGAAKTLHGRATVACICARSGKRYLLVLAAGEQPGLSGMTSSSCGGPGPGPAWRAFRASRVAWLESPSLLPARYWELDDDVITASLKQYSRIPAWSSQDNPTVRFGASKRHINIVGFSVGEAATCHLI